MIEGPVKAIDREAPKNNPVPIVPPIDISCIWRFDNSRFMLFLLSFNFFIIIYIKLSSAYIYNGNMYLKGAHLP